MRRTAHGDAVRRPRTRDAHGLLPADRGANLILLQPFDPVVFDPTSTQGPITYAAPSQVAVDCPTGNGRMPSEGDALIDWMVQSQAQWRRPGLATVMSKRAE
ncbi:MAG: hypothetical protein WCB86_05575 [Candidatus Dormiibacterota bacterium]